MYRTFSCCVLARDSLVYKIQVTRGIDLILGHHIGIPNKPHAHCHWHSRDLYCSCPSCMLECSNGAACACVPRASMCLECPFDMIWHLQLICQILAADLPLMTTAYRLIYLYTWGYFKTTSIIAHMYRTCIPV